MHNPPRGIYSHTEPVGCVAFFKRHAPNFFSFMGFVTIFGISHIFLVISRFTPISSRWSPSRSTSFVFTLIRRQNPNTWRRLKYSSYYFFFGLFFSCCLSLFVLSIFLSLTNVKCIKYSHLSLFTHFDRNQPLLLPLYNPSHLLSLSSSFAFCYSLSLSLVSLQPWGSSVFSLF